ncbi:MAG: hypothetical protein HY698_09055 [Deltaproteobacteria bacterium]|nr:hypothetical protein [Deltaproteobacteria bacterium]
MPLPIEIIAACPCDTGEARRQASSASSGKRATKMFLKSLAGQEPETSSKDK